MTSTSRSEEAAGDELAASLTNAHKWADEIRPRVHPDSADDEIVCALTAFCLEIRALTLVCIAAGRE